MKNGSSGVNLDGVLLFGFLVKPPEPLGILALDLLRQDGAAQPRASTNRNTAVAIFAIQNKRNRGQRLRRFWKCLTQLLFFLQDNRIIAHKRASSQDRFFERWLYAWDRQSLK